MSESKYFGSRPEAKRLEISEGGITIERLGMFGKWYTEQYIPRSTVRSVTRTAGCIHIHRAGGTVDFQVELRLSDQMLYWQDNTLYYALTDWLTTGAIPSRRE